MSEVIPEIDKLYEKIRDWKETGDVPVVVTADVQRAIQMMKKRESLKPRISRLRKWVDSNSVAESKKKAYRVELLEKEGELREIEETLGL
jgi:hypothetical protein